MRSVSSGRWMVVTAYVIWGVLPIFWKLVLRLPAEQVLFHRIAWAFAWLVVLLLFKGQIRDVRALLLTPAELKRLFVSALLLGANWLTYLIAIQRGQVAEASLGYFICPIMSVALGAAFCGETLLRSQRIGVSLIAAGVGVRILAEGSLPWVALLLAVTFSLYTLLRRQNNCSTELGLCLETAFLLPIAAWYAQSQLGRENHWWGAADALTLSLLVASGFVTALPMLFLVRGAKTVPLQFVGVAQYLSPTITLLIACVIFGEPLTLTDVLSYPIIWLGIAAFISTNLRRLRTTEVLSAA